MNVENLFEGKGGYVFVSHSHLDIEKVRKIRNFLEDEGMEPILFYLRCMDGGDESKLDELKRLIFDEIDSREFFLYVKSDNAATSAWVQEELAYIRATHPDRITVIDISDDELENQETLSRMVRGMRVFISSSSRDRELTERISNALEKRDFRVYDVKNSIRGGDLWNESLENTMAHLSREGFVIALITEASIRSRFFTDELAYAVKNKVPILPVVAGNSYVLFELMKTVPEIGRYQLENLSADPTDEEIEHVVKDAVEIQKRFSYN